MSEQTCRRCGTTYSGSSPIDHECPDEEQANRVEALEERVAALEDWAAEMREAFSRRHEP